MIKSLLQKALREGIDYHHNPDFLCQPDEDQKLADICAECMQEIYAMRRNAGGENWTWRKKIPGLTSSQYIECSNIIGCWVYYDEFYTNQNHPDWQR